MMIAGRLYPKAKILMIQIVSLSNERAIAQLNSPLIQLLFFAAGS
jgi:hypothetical protein